MHGLLTSDLVIAVLLVTTFACVGLLAVWAATSPRHWFIRTAFFFAILSPLLAIPAYELFLAFALAVTVTYSLVLLERWYRARRARRESRTTEPTLKPRFSLGFALLLTATLAAALGVAVHIPVETWNIWPVWSINGLILAVAFSSIAIFGIGGRLKWRYRILIFAAAIIAAGACLIFCGGSLSALTNQTPFASAFGIAAPTNVLFWSTFASIAVLLLSAALILCGLSTAAVMEKQSFIQMVESPRAHRCQRAASLGLLIAIACPPAATVWELTHPLPIPNEEIPQPNGIVELEKIGKKCSQSTVVKLAAADQVDHDRLGAAVAGQKADYDEIVAALKIPGWIPAAYDESYFNDMDTLSNRRNIARLLAAKSDVEIFTNNVDDAFQTHCHMLQAGEILHRGGLALDFLVATAVDQMAYEQIHKSINALNRQQCIAMQRELMAADNRRRGIDDVLYREHVFMQRNIGWVGHLTEFIDRICSRRLSDWNVDDGVITSHHRAQALARLLTLKLAIRAFELDHSAHPSPLSQLVPDYIPSLPIDPSDPTGQPLRYRTNGDKYVLYSVGEDGDDDGGRQASTTDDGHMIDTDVKDGDLSLDEYFAEMEAPADEVSSAGTKSDDSERTADPPATEPVLPN